MRKVAGTDGRRLYDEFRRAWSDVQERAKNVRSEKAFSKYTLMPFIAKGRKLSQFVLENKSVPRNKSKDLEMATRAFLSVKRQPRKPLIWIRKKTKRVRFLLDTESFPEKEMGGDELFELGPFTVHNTVGAEGRELEMIRDLVRKAVKFIRKMDVPKSDGLLYGDVLLVGRLQQAHTMAWYSETKDTISLSVRKNVDSESLHYLIHEFGHRLWRKELARSVKRNWARWHGRAERKGYDMPLPDVGDPLGFDLQGMDEPVIQKIDGDRYYVSEDGYLTIDQIYDAYTEEFAYPTRYAAVSKEEHFCEAFAMYAMGTLGSDHERMFRKLVVRGQDIDE